MDTNKIGELVSKAADTKATEDYDRLFVSLSGAELFFNINSTPDTNSGTPMPVSTPLVDIGHGQKAVVLFTSKDNANLNKNFGGIEWKRALEMLLKMPQADGLILQNNESAWVGIDKQKATVLLESFSG